MAMRDWILLTRVSPISEAVTLEKHVHLMDSTPQDVAEAKSLHGSKERQGKFTDQKYFQAVNSKKHLQVRKSLICKWLEAGRVPKEVSCIVHPVFILFPRYLLLMAIRGRAESWRAMWYNPIQCFYSLVVYVLNLQHSNPHQVCASCWAFRVQ